MNACGTSNPESEGRHLPLVVRTASLPRRTTPKAHREPDVTSSSNRLLAGLEREVRLGATRRTGRCLVGQPPLLAGLQERFLFVSHGRKRWCRIEQRDRIALASN